MKAEKEDDDEDLKDLIREMELDVDVAAAFRAAIGSIGSEPQPEPEPEPAPEGMDAAWAQLVGELDLGAGSELDSRESRRRAGAGRGE